MKLMGASGLALAGSIGGLIFFILTIRGVGVEKFIHIIQFQKLIYLMVGLGIMAYGLWMLNQLLMAWIR
jgi:putative peptidoglycan lipid II flippase